MDDSEEARELERKIAQASRIASSVSDQTTLGRLVSWIDELRYKLQSQREKRHLNEAITKRARDLWERAGRPQGRDLDFWLQAESEAKSHSHSGSEAP